MFGIGSFAEFAFADVGYTYIPPTPVVVVDTHDGDEKRKKAFEKEAAAKAKKKAELKAIYEELVEGKPRIAEEIVAPFMVVTEIAESGTVSPIIDYDKLLLSLDTVAQLYREYQELDDEEVLLLL